MLVLEQLSKTYAGARSRSVLRGVNLVLGAGEYIAVMGESGIGKSTLLNLIAGLAGISISLAATAASASGRNSPRRWPSLTSRSTNRHR